MVRSGAVSRRHFRAAALQNKFENLLLLKDAAYLRDRLGIKLAFLEDPMLEGMLAARYTKGVRAAINGQLVDKLKAEAAERKDKSERLQAARSLLGPKGGLPTLKQDLLRLATLLHVEVQASDSIDKLKAKIRPTLDALRGIPLPTTPAASSLGTPAASSADLPVPRREPEQRPQQRALQAEVGQRTAGPMEPTGPRRPRF